MLRVCVCVQVPAESPVRERPPEERVVPRLGAHETLDPLDGKSHEELERVSA
jgi:hypothetical protein